MKLFAGRTVAIATAHHKERVMAPILERELGVSCTVPTALNTDSLGTFSGEIPRVKDVISTLRDKCNLAMKKNKYDLVVASEGSFGAHPSSPFLPANYETVLLLDAQNNREYTGRYWTSDTNFTGAYIKDEEDLEAFVTRVGFPQHAVIVRKDEQSYAPLYKGVQEYDELVQHFQNLKQEFGSCYVETDMRAHFNPKRMTAIAKATQNLVDTLLSLCPQCQAPGFSVQRMESGLPCGWCKQPTRSPLYALYHCDTCSFEEKRYYPLQKEVEDPQFCDYCNP